jgi:hypothetical protein
LSALSDTLIGANSYLKDGFVVGGRLDEAGYDESTDKVGDKDEVEGKKSVHW